MVWLVFVCGFAIGLGLGFVIGYLAYPLPKAATGANGTYVRVPLSSGAVGPRRADRIVLPRGGSGTAPPQSMASLQAMRRDIEAKIAAAKSEKERRGPAPPIYPVKRGGA